MYSSNVRFFVPMAVKFRQTAINVKFLFDTGSLVTYLRAETFWGAMRAFRLRSSRTFTASVRLRTCIIDILRTSTYSIRTTYVELASLRRWTMMS
jgi:hypothetical protein